MDGISLQNMATFTQHSLKLWTSEFANLYEKASMEVSNYSY